MTEMEKALKLQAYALLLHSNLPHTLHQKIIGDIIKEIGLPITAAELEEGTEEKPGKFAPVYVGRTEYPFHCPLCHEMIKEKVALPLPAGEMTKLMAEHLPKCVLLDMIAERLRQ